MRSILLQLALLATGVLGTAVPGNYQAAPAPKCPQPVKKYATNNERLLGVYKNFWDNWMYPKNVAQAKTVESSFFAPNVQGRVDMTGTFDGPELNTEYVFGLFVSLANNADAVSLLAVPETYEIRSFVAGGNLISGSIVGQFKNFLTNITHPVVVRMDILLDECDRILQYDAVFERTEWFLTVTAQDFIPIVAAKTGLPKDKVTPTILNVAIKSALIKSVCSVHTQYCKGSNLQYKDESECTAFLNTLEVGAGFQLGQNTIGCRNIHSNMVSLRPEVHCPHIGKTGGGMCIDRKYDFVSNQVYFNHSMVMSIN